MNIYNEEVVVQKSKVFDERITQFVHAVFLKAFEKYGWSGDYQAIIEDDLEFFPDSDIFVAAGKITNNIYGTIKAIHKKDDKLLPVERDFGLRCDEFLESNNLPKGKIIEVARFATDHFICQNNGRSHKEVTKSLMHIFCEESRKKKVMYWVASIDKDVLVWLMRVGFKFIPTGEPKFYLGSPTVPVYLNAQELPM